MIVRRKGYLIVLYTGQSPREPDETAVLFGPVTSPDLKRSSESLSTNGLKLFGTRRMVKKAELELRKCFNSGDYKTITVRAELCIAESSQDWEALRSFGSYIAAMTQEDKTSYMNLYGTAWVGGRRVRTAHDTWVNFFGNGLHPFTDFGKMVGEGCLGVLPELSRQAQCPSKLIGIKIEWETGA